MRIGEYAELKNLNDSDMYIVDTDSGTYKVKGSTLKEFIGGGIEVPEPDLSEIESAVKANTSSIAAFETRMNEIENVTKPLENLEVVYGPGDNPRLKHPVIAFAQGNGIYDFKMVDIEELGDIAKLTEEQKVIPLLAFDSSQFHKIYLSQIFNNEITFQDVLNFNTPGIYDMVNVLQWTNTIGTLGHSTYRPRLNSDTGKYYWELGNLSASMIKNRKIFFANHEIGFHYEGYFGIYGGSTPDTAWTDAATGLPLSQPLWIIITCDVDLDTGLIKGINDFTANFGSDDEISISLARKYNPDKFNPAIEGEIATLYWPEIAYNTQKTTSYIRVPIDCTNAVDKLILSARFCKTVY